MLQLYIMGPLLSFSLYQKLKSEKPFFTSLAPMEDVTDTVFRQVLLKIGRPDLFFSEFMNVEGFCSQGREAVEHRLLFVPEEKPLIAQIWGINPESFRKAVPEIEALGFDGIDINFGCPVAKIVKQGACSAMIDTPELAGEIIQAVQESVKELPVSVKTRIGFKTKKTEGWLSHLLHYKLAGLTVHPRIAIEMSKKPADWGEVSIAVKLRNEISPETIIIGNGDVKSLSDAAQKVKETGVDGIMIGRGVFENPWIFNEEESEKEHSPVELLELLVMHIELFVQTWGDSKNSDVMRKFFKMYVRGFSGAGELRDKLYEIKNLGEVVQILQKEISKYSLF